MEILAKEIGMEIEKNKILKGITMGAKEKEFIGIIGPNGSGKSTLLKCIYRVLKPNHGSVFIGGDDLYKIPPKESAKRMAVVAQHNYYSFDFSVEEVVLMGRSPYKKMMAPNDIKDYSIVREALEKVGMTEFARRNFSTLSGGEQQRIILARALAQKTQTLILDEPTNHLDIKYQLQLMDIVKGLDITVVAAIHDLNIAAMYCDKIYVIKDGQVVVYGTPREVLTKQLIRQVYEVDVQILEEHETARIHILYKSDYSVRGEV